MDLSSVPGPCVSPSLVAFPFSLMLVSALVGPLIPSPLLSPAPVSWLGRALSELALSSPMNAGQVIVLALVHFCPMHRNALSPSMGLRKVLWEIPLATRPAHCGHQVRMQRYEPHVVRRA